MDFLTATAERVTNQRILKGMNTSSKSIRRTRHNQAGVSVVEAIFAVALLSMIIAVAFAALIRSVSMSSEARNIDEARNVLNSLADEFMSTPYRIPGTSTISPILQETAPTGGGLRWSSEDIDGGNHLEITLFEGEYAESSVTGDPLSDDVRAEVTREVTKVMDAQLGPLLQGTFTIQFSSGLASGTVVRKEITVARAIVE